MFRNNHNRKIGLLTIMGAAAMGTLLGLGIGVMIAPQTGCELRDQISAKTKDLYNKAKTKINDIEKESEGYIEDIEEKLDDSLDEIKKDTQEFLE